MRSITLLALAKGLGLRRARLLMIGSVFVLIGSYSMLLLGAAAGGLGRVLFLVTVFIFSLIPTLLSTADTLSSGEGASVFRFLGASGRTITAACLSAVVEAGLSGTIVGVILGLLFSNFVLGASSVGDLIGVLPNLAFVLASTTAGISAGVAVGVGLSWKNSS